MRHSLGRAYRLTIRPLEGLSGVTWKALRWLVMRAPVVVTYKTWHTLNRQLVSDSAEAQYFCRQYQELQGEYAELLEVREGDYARWRVEQLHAVPQLYILGAGPLEQGVARAREAEESEQFSDSQGERPPHA